MPGELLQPSDLLLVLFGLLRIMSFRGFVRAEMFFWDRANPNAD